MVAVVRVAMEDVGEEELHTQHPVEQDHRDIMVEMGTVKIALLVAVVVVWEWVEAAGAVQRA